MPQISRKKFLRNTSLGGIALLLNPLDMLAAGFSEIPGSNNVTYYRKDNPEYAALKGGFNARIKKAPLVIALCKNTGGVSEAVKYARQNKLPVAVKSSGHCMEGFSSNNGGLVIHLTQMNSVEFIDAETVKLGPGCTLSRLYDNLLPKRRIIPGGSCSGVAVAGLSLGGGYGLNSRRFGLTCDSLLEVTMVDGEGNIHNSNGNSELLWACRGGGNGNFGIITELTFKTHPAPATMQSFRFKSFKMTGATAKAKMEQWFAITAALPNSCFSAFLLNHKTVYILLTNTGPHTAAVQKAVAQLKAMSETTTQNTPTPLAKALKVYYGRPDPLEFKNASAGLYKSFADIEGCVEQVLDIVAQSPGMIYQVNTLGGAVLQSGSAATSSFPHREYLYFSELQAYWGAAAQAAKLMTNFEKIQQIFEKHGIQAQYRNYPDINFKNWEQKYYSGNYVRLQALKKKYDPNNTIRHEQSVKAG